MATVYVAWVDSNRVYFNDSDDDGATWGTPQTVDNGNVAGYTRHSPKIQVDADGDVYVVWLRKKTFGNMAEVLVINHTADGGTTWSGTTDISDVPGADMTEYLGFIIDSTGYLWLFFGRQNWKPGVWYYKSTNIKDYDTWDNEAYITMSLEPASQIDVCEDGATWLWITYSYQNDASSGIAVHRYDGSRWICQANAYTNSHEDFTGYTETDPGADITVTATKCDVDTMDSGVEAYVRADKGAGTIGDFEHRFKTYLDAIDSPQCAIPWAVTNGASTFKDMDDADDGIAIYFLRQIATYKIILKCWENGALDTYEASILDTPFYITVERSGSAVEARIYSDPERTSLVDTLSVTATSTTYRYVFGVASYEWADNGAATFYTENLALNGEAYYPEVYAESGHVFVSYYKEVDSKAYLCRKHNGGWQAAVEIGGEQWPSLGGCILWAATVGSTASMEVNQRDSNDAGQTWGAATERSHGEGDAESITGHKAVNYAHTPYSLFVTASHKIFCCKGAATE